MLIIIKGIHTHTMYQNSFVVWFSNLWFNCSDSNTLIGYTQSVIAYSQSTSALGMPSQHQKSLRCIMYCVERAFRVVSV